MKKKEAIEKLLLTSGVKDICRTHAWWQHVAARSNQLPPSGEWITWLIRAGRGFGKTRTGAEWTRGAVESNSVGRIALVGRTAADVRDVIVEGESGILACSHPDFRPKYNPSKRRVEWPNGAYAICYSAEQPDSLRGPQHEMAWCDELAAWQYPDETWSNLMFGLRLGPSPKVCVTTTPRPIPLVKSLVLDPTTVVVNGSTFDNSANLPKSYLDSIKKTYEGTRLGRQEIYGEILDDTIGALWSYSMLDSQRVKQAPELVKVVVAVDPAASVSEESDETGIVACGIDKDGIGYVLRDISGRYSPHDWATRAKNLAEELDADCIIAETNQGGDMVKHTLQSVGCKTLVKLVHASRGKQSRAEPISALYEQSRVKHVGTFAKLEDQMCTWVPGVSKDSPDRVDALVYALTSLMLNAEPRLDRYDTNLFSAIRRRV